MAHRDDLPSIREIAQLTARLRRLSAAGRDADPAERAAFLTDKDALIARIEAANHRAAASAGQEREPHDDEPTTSTETGHDDAHDDGKEWSR